MPLSTPKKHILFLASWYPNRILLDNGDFIQRHAQAIALGYEITVVHALKDEQLKEKYLVTDSVNRGVREIIVYFRPSFFSPLNLLFLVQAFLLGVKRVKLFDVIHLHVTYPAGLVALFLKRKYKKHLVLTEHWTAYSPENFRTLALYKRFLIRQILKKVDYLAAVSKNLEEKVKKVYPIQKTQVIPNVVNVAAFGVYGKGDRSTPAFLHVSHLGYEHKNIQGMLNVAKRLSDDGYNFCFNIGGNGDLEPIKEFVKEHHLETKINVFGRLVHAEVCEKMNQADCFILFSNYENQPCVQIEAFACGLPVIATDVGGISEFFPKDFGYIVQKGDEEVLYQKMVLVIKGVSFARKDEMNAYAKNHFSVEVIAKQYSQIYQELLKEIT